ncbi:hypothetical protein O1611_g9677 [Lasiodiplodia mahajangana]|uniref:Uncharacterized protein n=1 Tax=Lasiodiplodia mahajangana TaxID=1108764 RepID=A0ACC2J6G1_9PEZI|nr:hypothetical protein O1611_g9677 [Lasiodiplodia mahajangana]
MWTRSAAKSDHDAEAQDEEYDTDYSCYDNSGALDLSSENELLDAVGVDNSINTRTGNPIREKGDRTRDD